MQIVPVSSIDIRMAPGAWPLPPEMRAAVASYWAAATKENPHLWDGRVLGLTASRGTSLVGTDGVLRAEALEDAYSAMMLWRSRGFPEIGIRHAFGWALIVSDDGALIYGVMGGNTANGGRIYPPGGGLEPRDVLSDASIDYLGSIALELEEETGLSAADARAGMTVAVLDGPYLSVGRVFHFAEPAVELAARIRANLEQQTDRELADVVVIRTRADAVRLGAVPYAIAVAEAYEAGHLR